MALLVAGGISLFTNLFVAGFGFVDQFVTPLSTETRQRKEAEAAMRMQPGAWPSQPVAAGERADQASTVMGLFALLSFSVASATAIWAGYGMLRLRSYWLSVAGSFAVMPAASVCCLAGFPVGIWSLTVLLRPEVASAFR